MQKRKRIDKERKNKKDIKINEKNEGKGIREKIQKRNEMELADAFFFTSW